MMSHMEKRKILIITDWYKPVINGVVTSVVTLREELLKMGHEVRIATLSERGWAYKEDGVYYLNSMDAGRIYPNARAVRLPGGGFLKELMEWSPEIIHCQCEFSSFLIARKLAAALSIPIVHTYHTVYEDYTHYFCSVKPWGRQAAALFSRFVLDRTDWVIVPTEKVKKLLAGYGVERPVSVIPTGIRTEKYMPADQGQVREERAAVRARFGIGEGQKVLLALGRLAREKNLEEILDGFEALGRPDMELLIVGDGPYRQELEEKCRGMRSGARVHFAGMASPEETPAYYHAADWFVCASRSETQGLTYLEALSAGLPVICRRDECVEGIVQNGENGYQYDTLEEFAACCVRLAEDKMQQNFLSAMAVRTGMEYDASHFGERVLEVYEQALKKQEVKAAG